MTEGARLHLYGSKDDLREALEEAGERIKELEEQLAEQLEERRKLRAELLAAQDSEASALRQVEVMRAALEIDPWARTVQQWDGTLEDVCAWCGNTAEEGHAPDCQRQRALGA